MPLNSDPFLRPSFNRSASITGAVRIESVATRGIDWLWPRRIPLGKVSLLVGDPGLGKSLIALDIAARVSTGQAWPDEHPASSIQDRSELAASGSSCVPHQSAIRIPQSEIDLPTSPLRHPPSSVLLLSAEDDLCDTIRPRLIVAGADLSKIIAIPTFLGSRHDEQVLREHQLRRDLARLRDLLSTTPDCRLIIIDPISAYLTGVNSGGEVRRLIVPLAQLAEERQIAILAISHLRKQSGSAIHRTLGSLAFIASARAAWLVCQDAYQPDRRLMLPMKSNLAARAPGLAFTIEPSSPTAAPSPVTDDAPIIRWSPEPIPLSADEGLRGRAKPAGRPDRERDDAARWLRQTLAPGLRAIRDLEEEAVANGFRLVTLRRAFRELGGTAIRLGFGSDGHWYWQLPSTDPGAGQHETTPESAPN